MNMKSYHSTPEKAVSILPKVASLSYAGIGYSAQLADRSISDNLEFLLRATDWKDKLEIENRIWKVLNMVGIVHLLKKMPHEISGGEQQRVAIARALLNSPKLLVADEPTGNLDPDTALDILELLFKLSKQNNMAVVMATHDYRLIEDYPARVFRCTEGKLNKK